MRQGMPLLKKMPSDGTVKRQVISRLEVDPDLRGHFVWVEDFFNQLMPGYTHYI